MRRRFAGWRVRGAHHDGSVSAGTEAVIAGFEPHHHCFRIIALSERLFAGTGIRPRQNQDRIEAPVALELRYQKTGRAHGKVGPASAKAVESPGSGEVVDRLTFLDRREGELG